MNLMHDDIFKQILIWFIPSLLAITLHECAHGWVALKFGDTTARDRGRLSLNPIRHIDAVGTLIIPGLMLLSHMPSLFGWAKPVPVNFQRLSPRRLATVLVALAGPLANLAMMVGWAALNAFISMNASPEISIHSVAYLFIQMAQAGVGINLVLMLLNLIPIPPLDGGRIVGALLPNEWARLYMRLERYGIVILFFLILTGGYKLILNALLNFLSAHFVF